MSNQRNQSNQFQFTPLDSRPQVITAWVEPKSKAVVRPKNQPFFVLQRIGPYDPESALPDARPVVHLVKMYMTLHDIDGKITAHDLFVITDVPYDLAQFKSDSGLLPRIMSLFHILCGVPRAVAEDPNFAFAPDAAQWPEGRSLRLKAPQLAAWLIKQYQAKGANG